MSPQILSSLEAQSALDPLLFLAELSDRVANEYSHAIASISFASIMTQDDDARAVLDAAAGRLRRYAVAHRAHSAPPAEGAVDLSAYLKTLCRALARSRLEELGVNITLVEAPVWLEAKRCWRVGLIVSELISNAVRRAYPGVGGHIRVEVALLAETVKCRVSDDGQGPSGSAPGAGTAFVEALAADLGGFIERRPCDLGSSVVLFFPAHVPVAGQSW